MALSTATYPMSRNSAMTQNGTGAINTSFTGASGGSNNVSTSSSSRRNTSPAQGTATSGLSGANSGSSGSLVSRSNSFGSANGGVQGPSTGSSGSGVVIGNAKVRAADLFRFWLTTQSAQDSITRLVQEASNALGPTGAGALSSALDVDPFLLGSSGSNSSRRGSSNSSVSGRGSISAPAGAIPTSAAAGDFNMPSVLAVAHEDHGGSGRAAMADAGGEPQILIGMEDLPSAPHRAIGGSSASAGGGGQGGNDEDTSFASSSSPERNNLLSHSVAGVGGSLDSSLTGSLSNTHNSAGSIGGSRRHNRTTFSPHKSPREVKLGGLTSHMVDEVDAAHMRGALSPRALSPSAQLLGQDMHIQGASPFETSLGANAEGAGSGIRKPQVLHLDSLSSRRTETESNLSSRSTSPSTHDEFNSARSSGTGIPAAAGGGGVSTPTSGATVLPRTRSSSVSQKEREEEKKPRYATYNDVPRFYWAEGRPQTTSMQLEGPHHKKHENPHLIIHEGVAIPLGGGMVLTTEAGQPPPTGPRMPPLLPMATMEDEDVGPFIQREFASLPQPPSIAGAPAAGAAPGGRKGSTTSLASKGGPLRRPSTSNTRNDAHYQAQLFTVMRRIVTQAFGLPGYFTKLVMSKVVTYAPVAPRSPITPPMHATGLGGRPGSSQGMSQAQQQQQQQQQQQTVPIVSVAAVKEFYERHLRFKSIVRRMFEVLIATSKARDDGGPPPANGGAGATAGAGAPGGSGSGLFGDERASSTTGGSAASTGLLGGAGPGAAGGGGASNSSPPSRRNYLTRHDFSFYLEVLLETHQGLAFLRQTTDFQQKYLEAVLVRIFYDLDRHDRGRITWPEFEASKLPDAIRQVDVTDDINTVLNYFSYEHFYVLYCRFWELDEDKDLMLGPSDLLKYGPEGSYNPKIVERVFQGCGRRLSCPVPNKMNFEDFVWFCLSEEDKSTPRSIRYWFRILDADGDGIISGFEMENLYNFTKGKLLQMTTEAISFPDIMCQIRDMLPTMRDDGIRLEDLLRAPQSAHVAINMVCNVVKFLQFEQRDPFVAHHDRIAGGFEKTEWDRFARMEYDRMASEADEEQ